MSKLIFAGGSLEDLRAFPDAARSRAGFELRRVQDGREPSDWKPMSSVGPGVREIRVRDDNSDAYRVIYYAVSGDAVCVLHCFQKKTQKTRKEDIDLAKDRYKRLLKVLQR